MLPFLVACHIFSSPLPRVPSKMRNVMQNSWKAEVILEPVWQAHGKFLKHPSPSLGPLWKSSDNNLCFFQLAHHLIYSVCPHGLCQTLRRWVWGGDWGSDTSRKSQGSATTQSFPCFHTTDQKTKLKIKNAQTESHTLLSSLLPLPPRTTHKERTLEDFSIHSQERSHSGVPEWVDCSVFGWKVCVMCSGIECSCVVITVFRK